VTDLLLIRAFASEFARTSRDTLETRLLPFNTPTRVSDPLPNGELDVYTEEIAPSMFASQLRAAHPQTLGRIRFFDGHPNQDGSSKLGWATGLRADNDWLYGTFKLQPSRVDDVEAMLEGGIKDVSVGFIPLAGGTTVRADGSRLRIKGHLDHVALEPEGAYAGAEVTAMRALALEEADRVATAAQETLEHDDLEAWLKAQEDRQATYSARARGVHG